MRIAKLLRRVTVLLWCSLAVILTVFLAGNRDKAAAQTTSDVATQNATPQNQGNRPSQKKIRDAWRRSGRDLRRLGYLQKLP